jgi:hypothetical protein
MNTVIKKRGAVNIREHRRFDKTAEFKPAFPKIEVLGKLLLIFFLFYAIIDYR